MADAIAMSPKRSKLLLRLVVNLDLIRSRLNDRSLWRGARIGIGTTAYSRLEATDLLVARGKSPRTYTVGVHHFDQVGDGGMHDHRWPFAVYPFGEHVEDDSPLYEMPWEAGRRSGSVTVVSGRPYAIETCSVRHAVRSARPHFSLVLADITEDPVRENRLAVSELDEDQVDLILARTIQALARMP